MIKNIYVGKAECGYFVDQQCNEIHRGQSCDCKNITMVETKRQAVEIGLKESERLGVILIVDSE